jgi:cytidine deaminase
VKKFEINTEITSYDGVEELSAPIRALMKKAIEAKSSAYAPYSKFRVGAAILLENGQIITGNNQENAAYPSGICAERVAVWHASSQYPNQQMKAIAIAASSASQQLSEPIAPCGACRQALSEYELKQGAKLPVYFMGEVGKVIGVQSVMDLLPMAFDKSFL